MMMFMSLSPILTIYSLLITPTKKSTYSAIRFSNHSSRPLYVSIQDLIHAVTGLTPAMVFFVCEILLLEVGVGSVDRMKYLNYVKRVYVIVGHSQKNGN